MRQRDALRRLFIVYSALFGVSVSGQCRRRVPLTFNAINMHMGHVKDYSIVYVQSEL